MNQTRQCTKCGQVKPLTEFGKHARGKYGVRPNCKACAIARQAEYRLANLDKIAARKAAYQRANRDKIRARAVAYRLANRDRIAAQKAEHYRANRDEIRAQQTAYRQANPEKVAAYYDREKAAAYHQANPHVAWENTYCIRCRKHGLTPFVVSFTREDVVMQYGDACLACGGPFEELDHNVAVAAGGTHTLANVRPSCTACNNRKSNTIDRDDVVAVQSNSGA